MYSSQVEPTIFRGLGNTLNLNIFSNMSNIYILLICSTGIFRVKRVNLNPGLI